jgi:hypothetical protein
MLSATYEPFMLNVIMLSVVMLSVVAPTKGEETEQLTSLM